MRAASDQRHGKEGSAPMVDKSDIFADDYWKEQWKAVVAKERTADGDDVSLLGMSVQLARRWGPKFCPECEAKSRKLLDLVDAAYKILAARREQMQGDKKPVSRVFANGGNGNGNGNGNGHGNGSGNGNGNGNGNGHNHEDVATLRVLEVLEDIRDGLIDLSRSNGRH